MDQNEIDHLLKEGTPNMLTSAFIDRPICLIVVSVLALVALSAISFSLGYFKLSDSTNRDFLVWDDQKVIDYDMMVAGKEAIQVAAGQDQKPVRMQTASPWNAIVLIKAPEGNDNLLLKENLVAIDQVESELRNMADWSLFCKANGPDDPSCSDQAIISPLSYLETFAGKKWQEKTQDELDAAFEKLRSMDQVWKKLKFLFNKEE